MYLDRFIYNDKKVYYTWELFEEEEKVIIDFYYGTRRATFAVDLKDFRNEDKRLLLLMQKCSGISEQPNSLLNDIGYDFDDLGWALKAQNKNNTITFDRLNEDIIIKNKIGEIRIKPKEIEGIRELLLRMEWL